jgi:basic amino acid/polyamine antiporter, APA family
LSFNKIFWSGLNVSPVLFIFHSMPETPETNSAENALPRKLGLVATISVVVGSVIGAGIFMNPATMASQLPSSGWLLLVWIVGGLVSGIGASINAEIGTMLPHTGGQYVFFEKMYGRFFAYLYGWSAFSVINTASVAAIAYIFAQYSGYFINWPRLPQATEQAFYFSLPGIGKFYPLQDLGIKMVAILLVLALTWANYRSTKAGSLLQNLFTVIKIGSLILLSGFLLFSGKGQAAHFTDNSQLTSLSHWDLATGFVAALSGAFMAYDGWNNIGFVAGEIRNPSRIIPRALLGGLGICILLYTLTQAAYSYLLPIEKMKTSSLVAADALEPVLGFAGAGFISLLVMISTFGAVNGNILACARVSFAMGQNHTFFPSVGRVHKKFETPANALWLHGIWTCMFILSGTFDMLASLFVFVTWIFYFFAALGIFILRKKMKDVPRPYKAWGYPVLPLLFILFAAFYLVVTVYNDISDYNLGKKPVINSVLGLVLTLAGIPFYFYFTRKRK